MIVSTVAYQYEALRRIRGVRKVLSVATPSISTKGRNSRMVGTNSSKR
jgi:hypothetical protein